MIASVNVPASVGWAMFPLTLTLLIDNNFGSIPEAYTMKGGRHREEVG